MDKTLDTLTLYFRALLLLSATVLIAAIGKISTDEFSSDNEKAVVTNIGVGWSRFVGDVEDRATVEYRQQFIDALPPEMDATRQNAFSKVRFTPAAIRLYDGSNKLIPVPLPLVDHGKSALIGSLTALGQISKARADFPVAKFEPEVLRQLLATLESTEQNRSLLQVPDLMIEVATNIPGPGRCRVTPYSESHAKNHNPYGYDVPCPIAGEPRDLTDLVDAFRGYLPPTYVRVDLPFYLPPDQALVKLAAEDAKTKAADPIDLQVAKLDPGLAFQVAPVLIIVLLSLMFAPLRTVDILKPREPTAGGFWFGQFVGKPAWAMAFPFILLPTAATFVAAGVAIDSSSSRLLNGPAGGIGIFIVSVITLALSCTLFYMNYHAAKSWTERLKTSPIATGTLVQDA